MEQIIAKIDGMMCGMCESHMNDMVRNNFKEESHFFPCEEGDCDRSGRRL